MTISNHKEIPAYNTPLALIKSNNQFGVKYVSACNNLPGDVDRIHEKKWLLTDKQDNSKHAEIDKCNMNT